MPNNDSGEFPIVDLPLMTLRVDAVARFDGALGDAAGPFNVNPLTIRVNGEVLGAPIGATHAVILDTEILPWLIGPFIPPEAVLTLFAEHSPGLQGEPVAVSTVPEAGKAVVWMRPDQPGGQIAEASVIIFLVRN